MPPRKKKVIKRTPSQGPKVVLTTPETPASDKNIRKTSPYMSVYEYAALISARAAQLSNRFEKCYPKISLTNPNEYDPIFIATQEVREKLVSLIVRRQLPDGTTEDWLLEELEIPRI